MAPLSQLARDISNKTHQVISSNFGFAKIKKKNSHIQRISGIDGVHLKKTLLIHYAIYSSGGLKKVDNSIALRSYYVAVCGEKIIETSHEFIC